jgi:hypothetical protein
MFGDVRKKKKRIKALQTQEKNKCRTKEARGTGGARGIYWRDRY